MGICESCAHCGTKRQYMKTNLKVSVNHLPASNDWSISRKGFVLFSAITFVYCQSALSSPCSVFLPVDLFLWWCFLSFCLPSFLFPHFLPLLSPFLQICLPPSEGDMVHTDWLVDHADSHQSLWGWKSYAVTFPAFLLKMSRSSLSTPDRDPGGEEMGCCCNRFLHRHFLQVD